MTSGRELHGISCGLMSLKSLLLPCHGRGGIKGLPVAYLARSRLGGCGCRVTPRNQPPAAATNCSTPELLGQSTKA